MTRPGRGRARDTSIDVRILAVARRHLAAYGYERMSLAAVAEEAGTTRQALYRRWPGKAELAAAAVGSIAEPHGRGERADGPFAALVAELTAFRRDISRPGRLSLVGTMLQETTDPDVLARYRARVIAPRRERLRAILQDGIDSGLLDPGADLEVALTLCTGSWYGRALAEDRPPERWPERAAALVWRAMGGEPG
jgi:AcrR family transcriptional regulator